MPTICGRCHADTTEEGPHDNFICIQALRRRIEEIESKLGAASQRESATREDAASVATRDCVEVLSQAAAPSLSANYWRSSSEEAQKAYLYHYARACDLAGAVTVCCEHELDTKRLGEIALAFVRGEPLPQKGG